MKMKLNTLKRVAILGALLGLLSACIPLTPEMKAGMTPEQIQQYEAMQAAYMSGALGMPGGTGSVF